MEKDLYLTKNLFWGYSRWQKIKYSVTSLNRHQPSNRWWSISAMKCREECLVWTETHVLFAKMFTHLAKHGFVTSSLSRKDTPQYRNTNLSLKMFRMQRSERSLYWQFSGTLKFGSLSIFFEKSSVILNSTYFREFLRQYFTLLIE